MEFIYTTVVSRHNITGPTCLKETNADHQAVRIVTVRVINRGKTHGNPKIEGKFSKKLQPFKERGLC
jgi:hypothetical protein